VSEWADIKAEARKAVHAAFSLAATYVGPNSVEAPIALRVRWHPAGARLGDLAGASGYAEIVSTSDKVIFDVSELGTLDLQPVRGGVVTLAVAGETVTVRLDTKTESDGPIVEAWQVTRQ
jgi:hypothetical protein